MYGIHFRVKNPRHLGGRLAEGLERTQVRHLHVKGVAIVGDEDRRDAESPVKDEDRRSRIPG